MQNLLAQLTSLAQLTLGTLALGHSQTYHEWIKLRSLEQDFEYGGSSPKGRDTRIEAPE